MRKLIVLLLVVGLASWAFAFDLGNVQPRDTLSKGTSHVGKNPGKPDGREGGETIATALPITSLPYLDTGNICDNIDDYEEVCPYSSTSPDVVYSFAPATDMYVTISLCGEGTQYDTKVFVYENTWTPGTPYACNDDACSNSWTSWASLLEYVPMNAGNTYYIVVDGYGGDCGQYELYMEEAYICPVTCPTDAVAEGEPTLIPNYDDTYNGGCNSTIPVFQPMHWINADDPDGCTWMCGKSGWYNYAGYDYRDTDWLTGVAAGTEVTMTIEAQFETYIFFLGPTDCALVDVVSSALAPPCTPTSLTYTSFPGEEIWMWVGPSTFTGPVNEYDYFLKICGLTYDTIPVENHTWGGVKSLYR